MHDAKVYFGELAQQQYCKKEREPPELVRDVNLFCDQKGVVQSQAKIDKINDCPSEVKHPLLLPKYSDLTRLIIKECHDNCRHLGIAATLCKLRLSGY